MNSLEYLLERAAEIVRRAGLPKPSPECDSLFVLLLEEASRQIRKFKGNASPALSDEKRTLIEQGLSELARKLVIADIVAKSSITPSVHDTRSIFDIGNTNVKALSLKLFKCAQQLPIGDVAAWLNHCHVSEYVYKNTVGGKLPPTYIQVKSDIKRMIEKKMDLRIYATHSEAKKVLLRAR